MLGLGVAVLIAGLLMLQFALSPVIGKAYPYRLYAHCGYDITGPYFDGSSWYAKNPAQHGYVNVAPGFDWNGTLVLTSKDTLEFHSASGQVVQYVRQPGAPPIQGCQ